MDFPRLSKLFAHAHPDRSMKFQQEATQSSTHMNVIVQLFSESLESQLVSCLSFYLQWTQQIT